MPPTQGPPRDALLAAAQALCAAFAHKAPLDELLAHFSTTQQVSAREHGLALLAPFLGCTFTGLRGPDSVEAYFGLLQELLTYDEMSFGDWTVDAEARKVCAKGRARFTWVHGAGKGQWWDEQFVYMLGFDHECKVTDYQVWADSGAAYLAMHGDLILMRSARTLSGTAPDMPPRAHTPCHNAADMNQTLWRVLLRTGHGLYSKSTVIHVTRCGGPRPRERTYVVLSSCGVDRWRPQARSRNLPCAERHSVLPESTCPAGAVTPHSGTLHICPRDSQPVELVSHRDPVAARARRCCMANCELYIARKIAQIRREHSAQRAERWRWHSHVRILLRGL